MTALPTRKLEAYRYADVAALASVWSDLSPPERVEIAAQQKAQQLWLPSADPVQVRRAEIVLEAGATMNLAKPQCSCLRKTSENHETLQRTKRRICMHSS